MAEDTVAAISESHATGETAELYSDIRETMGVSAINLVWRHIATIDGGLRWAWEAARPLYVSGIIETECEYMMEGFSFPRLPVISETTLTLVGMNSEDRIVAEAILDTYNRGNAFNIVALSSLLVEPFAAPAARQSTTRMPSSSVPLPPIPEVADMAAEVGEQVVMLNELGVMPGPNRVIASIYKHLALWPGYLALSWAQLAHLHEDGTLPRLTDEAGKAARKHASHIAHALGPRPSGPVADEVCTAVDEFTRTVIARMIPIGQMMRQSLGNKS